MHQTHRGHHTRLLTILTLLVTTLGLAFGSASTAVAAKREAPSAYHCTAWKSGVRDCVKFTVFDQKFNTDYVRTFHNTFKKQTVTFQCSTSKQTTWTFSVSASAKASANLVFTKAEVTATAGVQRSVSTTDSASASLRVKPGGWANCKRGVYVYSIKGTLRHTRCSGPHCSHTYKAFTAKAPSRDAFFVGPGRG